MAKSDLVLLKGFNPDEVRGLVIRPTDDMEVYAVPERGLEVLDVLIDGRPVMYRNPAGHRSWRSWRGSGLNPLVHIEAAFTAGLENAGAPEGILPLHGTFSVTPARQWRKTPAGGVTGTIDCRRMVIGPSIVVERTIEPVPGKRAFRIIDDLHSEVGSDYMWLYHPNFPVGEGTEFVCSERLVVPRDDGIAKWGLRAYRTFCCVGRGHTRFPPSTDAEGVERENFEQCFIMSVEPDAEGLVRAMLRAADRQSAAYIAYNVNHFQPSQRAFQLWKNPRDAVSGLEVGNTFLGWSYAAEHDLLCHLQRGQRHHYELEIGFLTTAEEVAAFAAAMPMVAEPALKVMDKKTMVAVYGGR